MFTSRVATPDDYDAIAAVVDEWWDRPMLDKLPRIFLDHFWSTSTVVEDEQGLAAFLIGFMSPSHSEIAYIHFVGVRPDLRSVGLARDLYRKFFEIARQDGRREIHAVTNPRNITSIGFHTRLGFSVDGPIPDYDGPGQALMAFSAPIDASNSWGPEEAKSHL